MQRNQVFRLKARAVQSVNGLQRKELNIEIYMYMYTYIQRRETGRVRRFCDTSICCSYKLFFYNVVSLCLQYFNFSYTCVQMTCQKTTTVSVGMSNGSSRYLSKRDFNRQESRTSLWIQLEQSAFPYPKKMKQFCSGNIKKTNNAYEK